MGWVANLLIFAGTWLVGRKDRRAFIFTAVGEAVWTAVAIERGFTDLAVVCAVFGLMAIWNFFKWRKDAIREQQGVIRDRELRMMESRLNHAGYYLRNDLVIRQNAPGEDDPFFRDAEEGYSLVSFGPFERHHVFGGSRNFAIEHAFHMKFPEADYCDCGKKHVSAAWVRLRDDGTDTLLEVTDPDGRTAHIVLNDLEVGADNDNTADVFLAWAKEFLV